MLDSFEDVVTISKTKCC